ncbi:MAG TPA: RNA methyltransferase [Verrucomicrobiae bacterium]|nr:RNA methyltransferase [Verrucomicrobiae bacterium]
MRIEKIDSLELPELAPYRTLKRPFEHEEQGIFVAEGDKVVRRLLESHFDVVSVLLPDNRLAEFEPLLRARPEPDICAYSIAKKSVLEELVGFEMFQGVLAIGKIPEPLSLDKVMADSPGPRLFVAMDALTNAENLGVLVRNCAAFGTHALIVGETCSSPFLRRAVRNSMGTIFQLPILEVYSRRGETSSPRHADGTLKRRDDPVKTLVQTLHELRARGVRCIAAHPHTDKKTLAQADFTGDVCIVLGSEGNGISTPVLEACDEAVAIPMSNGVDSLNVGAAAAVFLYEVNRQRAPR